MFKKILLLSATLLTFHASAAPYVEYKHTAKLDAFHKSQSHFLRAGYKYKSTYLEVGDGSAEVGYKFKGGKSWTFKGKVERVGGKNKVENEIRYTF
jgi:hypothetical protein